VRISELTFETFFREFLWSALYSDFTSRELTFENFFRVHTVSRELTFENFFRVHTLEAVFEKSATESLCIVHLGAS